MREFVCGALLAASLAGIAYLAIAVSRTLAFGSRRKRLGAAQDYLPAVTVLKPLHGDEPDLFENLRSFCDQDYPDFQIVFGVRDERDAATAVARRLLAAFPTRDLLLVSGGRESTPNPKIANLLNMADRAKHDIIVVADSDICVEREYLRCVVAPFARADVGAVTCLYRAGVKRREAGTQQIDRQRHPWRRTIENLAAMFIDEQFGPSVLVATALGPMDFCLGATMAVTRKALDAIGGFAALGSYLADDQMLGRLVRQRGYRVELSTYIVETSIADHDLRALWLHELRWARTMHAAQPLGYSFSFLTYGLPLSAVYALACGGTQFALGVLGCALALRIALHYCARFALGSRSPDALWLIPVRDLFGLAIWAAHFFGSGVRWRDEGFSVDREGRLRATNRS